MTKKPWESCAECLRDATTICDEIFDKTGEALNPWKVRDGFTRCPHSKPEIKEDARNAASAMLPEGSIDAATIVEVLNAHFSEAVLRYAAERGVRIVPMPSGQTYKEASPELARAIAALGAVDLDEGRDGLGHRFAFQHGSHARWWTAYGHTIFAWWASHDYKPPTNGSCPHCVLMPSWWTPEQRFAVALDEYGTPGTRYAAATRSDAERILHAVSGRARLEAPRILTANLATGEEVPA